MVNDGPTSSPAPSVGSTSQEVVSLRTRTSRTYATPQGYQTVISLGSVNYQDASGAWKPIDDTLVASTTSGYAYQNKANAYALLLPPTLDAAPITVRRGNAFVAFTLVGAKGTLSTNGATATYASALPNLSVAYQAQADGAKETLTLQDKTAPSSYTYTLQISSGLTAKPNPTGGIDVVDAQGQRVFAFAPPFMSDSSNTTAGTSHAVTLTLGQSGVAQTLTLSADPTWLANPARVWPVVIDPSLQLYPTNYCYIQNDGTNAILCRGSTPEFYVNSSSTAPPTRALLQFDVSSVPTTSTIVGTDLAMYEESGSWTGTPTIDLMQLTQSWITPNWFTTDGSTPWTNPGGTFNATPVAQTTVGPPNAWYHWQMGPALVRGWVNGTAANDGVLFKMDNETQSANFTFGVSTCNCSNAPVLTITYAIGGAQPYWSYYSHALTDRMDLNVNLADGNLVLHAHDLGIAGTGLPLSLDRFSNSRAGTSSDFGSSWLLNLGTGTHLDTSLVTNVIFYDSSGTPLPFARNASTFTAPAGMDATLVKNGDGSYTLTYHKSGTKENFGVPNGSGLAALTSIVDRNGNTLTIAHNADGTASTITDTQGRVVTFGYSPCNCKLVNTITDWTGRQVQYVYSSGYLTQSIDAAGKITTYAYTNGNLTQITDPNGNQTKLGYDGSSRVTSILFVTNNAGGTGYSYSFTYSSGNTVVTDPNSIQTHYYYDGYGRVTKVTDVAGSAFQTSWTADNHVATVTDAYGKVTTYSYSTDGNNNLVKVQIPTGAATSSTYQDTTHPYSPTSTTDAQGNTTTYAYDANGNLHLITDALSTQNQATINHNPNGTVSSVVDFDGNTWSYSYDAKGNLTKVTPPSTTMPPPGAPLGATTITPDSLSRPNVVQDGKGQITTTTYDNLDRVTQTTYNDKTTITNTFDADGNLTAMTDQNGTTNFTYDPLNRQTGKSSPVEGSFTYGYDGVGNLTSQVGPGGTTTYAHNTLNELTTVTDIDSTQVTMTYDANHNLLSTSYPNGVTESRTYDASQRIATIVATLNGANLTSFSYSYADPRTQQDTLLEHQETDSVNGNTTTEAYDTLNRLSDWKIAGGTNKEYQYSYDGNGNRTQQIEDRTTTTAYAYNAANEITQAGSLSFIWDADGNELSNSGGLSFTYNAKNQTTSVTPPNTSTSTMNYVGAGLRVSVGSTSIANSILGVYSKASGGATTYYTRDPDPRVLAEHTGTTTLYYLTDSHGAVRAIVDQNNTVKAKLVYCPSGNVVSLSGSISPLTFTTNEQALYFSNGSPPGSYQLELEPGTSITDVTIPGPGNQLCLPGFLSSFCILPFLPSQGQGQTQANVQPCQESEGPEEYSRLGLYNYMYVAGPETHGIECHVNVWSGDVNQHVSYNSSTGYVSDVLAGLGFSAGAAEDQLASFGATYIMTHSGNRFKKSMWGFFYLWYVFNADLGGRLAQLPAMSP